MKDTILKFVEEEVNPTLGEIIEHVEQNIVKEIKALEATGDLFKYFDETAGYYGEFRICNDENLF